MRKSDIRCFRNIGCLNTGEGICKIRHTMRKSDIRCFRNIGCLNTGEGICKIRHTRKSDIRCFKNIVCLKREKMRFFENTYYHIYNRTNNDEALFRCEENYLYFLKKYRYYLEEYLETVGYCLMPTHFHFLVRVIANQTSDVSANQTSDVLETSDVSRERDVSSLISKGMQKLQMSYAKAFNKKYSRHGSLFQAHFKAKPVPSGRYLITLLTYIHQNPVRSELVEKAEDWKYSSYQDYLNMRTGTLPNKEAIFEMINIKEMKELTDKSNMSDISNYEI